jgi:hypothetical protein
MLAVSPERVGQSNQSNWEGYKPEYFVEGKIGEAAKKHPLGPLFGTERLWLVPATVLIGGEKRDIEILNRIAIPRNPYHVIVAAWIGGYEPDLGVPVKGWRQDKPETASLIDIYASPNSPEGISLVREKSFGALIRRLGELGFPAQRLPINSYEEHRYYSSSNFKRPHLYPGGTRRMMPEDVLPKAAQVRAA